MMRFTACLPFLAIIIECVQQAEAQGGAGLPYYRPTFLAEPPFKAEAVKPALLGSSAEQSLTVTGYNFKFVQLPISFHFEAKAETDVNVVLAPDNYVTGKNDPNVYEFVIGGWDNSMSVINRGLQGTEISARTQTPDILSASEFRGFWITADTTRNSLALRAGRAGESVPFMEAYVADPLAVGYLAFATWIDHTAYFKLQGVGSVFSVVGYEFKFVQLPIIFHFEAEAETGVHVLLAPHNSVTGKHDPNVYEVVIGGWDNSKSVVKRGMQGTEISTRTQTPKILSPTSFRGFWITAETDNQSTLVLRVGKVGRSEPFMIGYDVTGHLPVGHLAFATWVDYVADFRIEAAIPVL